MKKKKLLKMELNEAIYEMEQEIDDIFHFDTIKEMAIEKIKHDDIGWGLHLLQAIYEDTTDAEYYLYDYNLGRMSTPTPITSVKDLLPYCED